MSAHSPSKLCGSVTKHKHRQFCTCSCEAAQQTGGFNIFSWLFSIFFFFFFSTEPKKRQCRVLFDYHPLNEDELELKTGDVVEIIEEVI